jgi:hypothetical protein
MKGRLTSFLSAFAFVFFLVGLSFSASAQGNDGTSNDGFVITFSNAGGAFLEIENDLDCGYGTANWGGEVLEDFCADIVWVHDLVGNDSLGCDSIAAGSLTGKIALVRRGTCEFGVKALNAEKAGAIAVIIVNHYATATDNGCTAIDIGAGAVGAQVTVPVIEVGRDIGEALDASINSGTVNACYSLPRLYSPFAPYHYATPVNHVDTLNHIAIRFVNRETTTLENVTLKADITWPTGVVESIQTTLGSVSPGIDTFVYLPAYLPPSIMGYFDICFSNSYYTESRDTVCMDWVHTEHTFASDNLVIDPLGVGPSNQQFIDAGFYVQSAALYITGPVEDRATYITFGLSNVDSVYVPDPGANVIGVVLYDGDANDDNVIDLVDNFQDLEILSLTTYEFDGTEPVDTLISVALQDDSGNPYVQLEARHPYYASVFYNGEAAATGRAVRFSNTLEVPYLNFPTTPLLLGTFFDGGWAGAIVIQRLQMEGFDPQEGTVIVGAKAPLDAAKLSIQPNPATDQLRVDLNLADVNKKVTLSLHDIRGNAVREQVLTDVQNGQVVFQVNDLPAGTYVLFVRTAEGSILKKVVVSR